MIGSNAQTPTRHPGNLGRAGLSFETLSQGKTGAQVPNERRARVIKTGESKYPKVMMAMRSDAKLSDARLDILKPSPRWRKPSYFIDAIFR